jgi:pyocin large subunit-like protein
VKPISGISIKLPENFCIDLAMLKQAKIHKPEPETGPREKSKLVVSGGVYGSTYSNTTPEENIRILRDTLEKAFKNVKKGNFPKMQDLAADNNFMFKLGLQQYKANNASDSESSIDTSV